jgi:Mg2+/Co2+ transporter CorB
MSMLMTVEIVLASVFVPVCLLVSSLLCAGQSALVSASRSRIHDLEETGNPRAAIVSRYLDTRERLVGALRFGRVGLNAVAASLGSALLVLAWGVDMIVATILVAITLVLFVEVTPRLLGAYRADAVALFVAPALPHIERLLGRAAKGVEVAISQLMRILGVSLPTTTRPEAAEELRDTVEILAKEGMVAPEARQMLGGLLDLRELTVADVMVHRTKMQMLDAAAPMHEIAAAVLESPYTRLPVFRDTPDNVVGILHMRALFRALQAAGNDTKRLVLDDLLTAPWFVPGTTSLEDQLAAFRRRKAHAALVVDEYGEMMGLVTLEDIIEEIVGDIADETDVELAGVRIQGDGSVMVDGHVPIRDVNRALDWDLPDDEATTVAGLVIHEARSIPEPGQSFTFYGFVFAVVKRERNRITRLRITPTASARRASMLLVTAAGGSP